MQSVSSLVFTIKNRLIQFNLSFLQLLLTLFKLALSQFNLVLQIHNLSFHLNSFFFRLKQGLINSLCIFLNVLFIDLLCLCDQGISCNDLIAQLLNFLNLSIYYIFAHDSFFLHSENPGFYAFEVFKDNKSVQVSQGVLFRLIQEGARSLRILVRFFYLLVHSLR